MTGKAHGALALDLPRIQFQTALVAATGSRSRRAFSREFFKKPPALRNQRAQGMPGGRSARVQNEKAHEHNHHGHTGFTRHSLRNGFNGFLRALPGDRAFLSPSLAEIVFRKLDASVGASGPHDFAVRIRRVRHERICVHRIPPPTSVTIAKRPSK
jgi:hypothetical protein